MPSTQAQLVQTNKTRVISAWLVMCLLLVIGMVLLGGYTRLSGSGLSITEWKPIHGSIPPLNALQWQEEFEKYQQIPQYQHINKGMSLEEFKTIFWPEFWHRNLGRLIGIVFALPLAWFYFRKQIAPKFALRLLVIFALGGLQGLMGWIMVASGLKDLLFVSHLKLAMHLGLALIIFGGILWALLDVSNHTPTACGDGKGGADATSKQGMPPLTSPQAVGISESSGKHVLCKNTFAIFLALVFIQIIFGAFMAGLHAGLIYNTFPLMNGALISPETFDFQDIWLENIPLIQFIHRWLAKFLCLYFILWWWFFKGCASVSAVKSKLLTLASVLLVQFALGVLTLIHAAPLHLALTHQVVGVLLFAVTVILAHSLIGTKKP